jgi:demethylmenaquinone methyltransferase/2-methoxy-6-polyprenyl-1,4-benzoquinol methylase
MKDKAAYVHGMFSAIAGRYDFLNTILSFGRDRHWRSSTVSILGLRGDEAVLDVATGTGKLARELGRQIGGRGRVVGIDFCPEMLHRARGKAGSAELVLATAERTPFRDNTFDCATVGFALRNVPDVERMLRETARVVKPGGRVVCLEFSRPRHQMFRMMHRLYLSIILPLVGRLISGDREAYVYLPRSIMEFCEPEELHRLMRNAGLDDPRSRLLTWGVVAVHTGTKS